MARTQKNGLSFFSFDTDFFDDIAIKVLKARYGADGLIVYIYIVCQIYKYGFYLEADEDFFFIMADELGMDPNKIGQIVNFLCGRSLLDGKLFTSDKVLTSRKIQKLYQLCMKSRKLNRNIVAEPKYWVLSEEETEPFIKFTQNQSISRRNDDNSGKKEENLRKNPTKERKEKERKEKENICADVIEFLNQKAGTNYRPLGTGNSELIEKKLNEGYTLENFKEVIDKKCAEWKGSELEKYLRPQTLFGDKFETYLNEKINPKNEQKATVHKTKFSNFTERKEGYGQMEQKKTLEMMEYAGSLQADKKLKDNK